jgi:CRP/FNR family transcriptional regulator, cyclic AMP receptor protein
MPAIDDLERLPIFAGVSHEQIERLAMFADELDVPAGTALTHEGRHEGPVFVVVSGVVGIERGGRTVDTIGPGDILGEIGAIDGGPRTATGRAIEDAHVIALSPKRFNDLLDEAPELGAAMMARMEERLGRIDAEAEAGSDTS